MDSTTDRRAFLKGAAMTAAASALLPQALASAGEDARPGDDLSWSKVPCRFCGTGCHVQVGVKNDKVIAIAGDPKAEVNKGLLCVKGYHVGTREREARSWGWVRRACGSGPAQRPRTPCQRALGLRYALCGLARSWCVYAGAPWRSSRWRFATRPRGSTC